MKYFLGYLIKGEAKKFHQDLTKKISEKFGVSNVSARVPPHLTLKIPFSTNRISEVEDLLFNFCEKNEPTELKLYGFGHFGERVVFMKAHPSKEMEITVESLTRELETIKWLRLDKHDMNRNFHATLANYDIRPKYQAIWEYLMSLPPLNFDLYLDNLAVLIKKNNRWLISKEFVFK